MYWIVFVKIPLCAGPLCCKDSAQKYGTSRHVWWYTMQCSSAKKGSNLLLFFSTRELFHIESEGQETKQVPRMVTILEPTVSNTKLPWHKIDFNCWTFDRPLSTRFTSFLLFLANFELERERLIHFHETRPVKYALHSRWGAFYNRLTFCKIIPSSILCTLQSF